MTGHTEATGTGRDALAAVLRTADHCHAIVVRDGIEDACGKPPVAVVDGRRSEDQSYWPACAYHANYYGRMGAATLADLAAVVADAERKGAEKALRDAADEARAHAVSCPESCGTVECREANEITAAWLTARADRHAAGGGQP